jgi:hypothetical protein
MTLHEFKLNIKWWESKRLIFNLVIISSGLISFYDGYSRSTFFWDFSDTVAIFRWIIFANISYSLGILLEIFDWYYLKNKLNVVKYRLILFSLGIVFSFLLTLLCGFFVFSKPHLW